MAILEDLTEEECYLWALLSDDSGLDQAEFTWYDAEQRDGCFRAWPFQWRWWRNTAQQQIDQAARSVGKSLSIQVRAFAFPFLHPGQEMVVTAPEGNHLDAITDNIETKFMNVKLGREMLVQGRSGVKHRPFHMNFANGSRIMGRIPQRDGKGVKGCLGEGELVLTRSGLIRVEDLRVGDEVATHTTNWKKIVEIKEDMNDCYEVRGSGSYPIKVSCDHRFMGAANVASGNARKLSDTMFQDVEFLLEDKFYWATPTKFPYEPVKNVEFSEQSKRFDAEGASFWWLVGRYLADGYLTFNGQASRKVHYVVVPEKAKDVTQRLNKIGLAFNQISRTHSSADVIDVCSTSLSIWLEQWFGRLADGKRLPSFVLSMNEEDRRALLTGYLSGDGYWNENRQRWEFGTASKELAVGLQFLAQSLGHQVNVSVSHSSGGGVVPIKHDGYKTSWRVQIVETGHAFKRDDVLLHKVKSVTPIGPSKIYNLVVEDDHSYVSGSIISHNIHPIWLELDEAQDYPDAGWTEIIETLKMGSVGAVWRAHGVTRGQRDYFYKFTQPDSGWQVHRLTAMHRPTWTDDERQKKIESYGSRDHPDYRRNVLGLHGDATNPLFVLHRLMQCVDNDNESSYNKNEYTFLKINNEMVLEYGDDILPLLDFPHLHQRYANFWIGMDVGYTNHPSEIVVFAETKERAKDSEQGIKRVDPKRKTALKLLSRIRLERISHGHQVQTILWLVNLYKPHAFAMDKTGLGLPLFQDIQERASTHPDYRIAVDSLKGYNFSGKILVDFDTSVQVDEYRGDIIKESGIERNVLEYSSDRLRAMVDDERLILPNSADIVREFQGQTWVYDKSTMDMYGRRKVYSKGSFHVLDATRMAVLGYAQHAIEDIAKSEDRYEPVKEIFVF